MTKIPSLSTSRVANATASLIFRAFEQFHIDFQSITQRARERFNTRDWKGGQGDAVERLELYRTSIDAVETDVREGLGERVSDPFVWASAKAVYSGLIEARDDWELAETFFNSVTRRVFTTVGVDPQLEFVDTDFTSPPTTPSAPVYRTYPRAASTSQLIENILSDFAWEPPFAHLTRDAALCAKHIHEELASLGAMQLIERAEIVQHIFFRGKGAYVIGRLTSGTHVIPFALALLHCDPGIVVDAILLDEDDISVLFSFAHSYFKVDAPRPYELVRFLKSLLPRKRVSELYISLGYNKHGKTELFRELYAHLTHSVDEFILAPGVPGMVMLVFTLPSFDMVFKVIKDRFAEPKNISRRGVMDKYKLVFRHDRAGRLIDAQEFEHLRFARDRFAPNLLDAFREHAAETITITDDAVIFQHLYTERRLTPLDMYVRNASPEHAQAAVIDYGQAIKDLAGNNIFPGDILLKNFGVTRHGRVVFYDYDELTLLTDCRFLGLPSRGDWHEAATDRYAGDDDIFPEQFSLFLGLRGPLRQTYTQHHGELFTPKYWRSIQKHIRAGTIQDVYPYQPVRRLRTKPPISE